MAAWRHPIADFGRFLYPSDKEPRLPVKPSAPFISFDRPVIVILAVSILILIFILRSVLQTQRALHWWQRRQALQSHQVAEEIRNGLLQKSFSLRRHLEVALAAAPGSGTLNQDWLQTLEALHHDFKDLSDRLSPPYLEESLPLAIQYRVTEWQHHYPGWRFQCDFPAEWPSESPEHSRVILTMLDELLRIVCVPALSPPSLDLALSPSIQLDLQVNHVQAALNVQIGPSATGQPGLNPESADLRDLARAFAALTGGRCVYQPQSPGLTSYWCWPLVGNAAVPVEGNFADNLDDNPVPRSPTPRPE